MRRSLINEIKRRLVKRRTKSDQFIQVRNMPIKEVIVEMDTFFNDLAQIVERYKIMRRDLIRERSISLLSDMAKAKKKFIRTVTAIRTWRDSIPKFQELKNIKLANELYKKGYEEQAFSMCDELGIKYFDHFPQIKNRLPMKRERSHSLVNKAVIRQLELSFALKNKKLPVPKNIPRKTYYFHIDAFGNYVVHHHVLEKSIWAATHYLWCVPSPLNIISIDQENPQVGQVAKARGGEYVLIAKKSKRDFNRIFKFEAKDAEREKNKILTRNLKEKKRIAAARELALAPERAAKKAEERKIRIAKYKKKRIDKQREKRHLEAAEIIKFNIQKDRKDGNKKPSISINKKK